MSGWPHLDLVTIFIFLSEQNIRYSNSARSASFLPFSSSSLSSLAASVFTLHVNSGEFSTVHWVGLVPAPSKKAGPSPAQFIKIIDFRRNVGKHLKIYIYLIFMHTVKSLNNIYIYIKFHIIFSCNKNSKICFSIHFGFK